MSNTPKVSERKIRPPPDFNGNREEADNFLNSCRVYLRLNAQSYSTDEEKIIFILSYMIGGSAGPWKDAFTTKAFSINPTTSQEHGFGTLTDFIKEFNKSFEPLNPVDNAIAKMKALKQTGTADDYVAEFLPLAVRSGIGSVAVLSDYFLTGLKKGLVNNIMTVEKLPTTMDGYYTLASRLDLQWRKGQELTKGSSEKKSSDSKGSTTSTQGKSSNAIRLRKLTDEERTRYKKEGRCFRCRELGHGQWDCPQRNTNTVSPNQGTTNTPAYRKIRIAASEPNNPAPAEPEAPVSRVRALFRTFTPAEREEVVNIAEAEGF